MLQNLQNPSNKRIKSLFTKDEDDRLKAIIGEFASDSEVDWHIVAQKMQSRTARQCKERWYLYLSNTYNRAPFSFEEKYIILYLVKNIGKRWVIISKYLNNRSNVDVKSEYVKLTRNYVTLNSIFIHESEQYKKMTNEQRRVFIYKLRELNSLNKQNPDETNDFPSFLAIDF